MLRGVYSSMFHVVITAVLHPPPSGLSHYKMPNPYLPSFDISQW